MNALLFFFSIGQSYRDVTGSLHAATPVKTVLV